jgi:hypothetical protein
VVLARGNYNEADLFVARCVLDMLARDNDLSKARYIRENTLKDLPKEQKHSPVLNFVDFALEAVELQDFDLYNKMCNEGYSQALDRDSNLLQMANSISSRHFKGRTIK